MTVDVPVQKVRGYEVRPANQNMYVDINSDAVRQSSTSVLTRLDVGHVERIGL